MVMLVTSSPGQSRHRSSLRQSTQPPPTAHSLVPISHPERHEDEGSFIMDDAPVPSRTSIAAYHTALLQDQSRARPCFCLFRCRGRMNERPPSSTYSRTSMISRARNYSVPKAYRAVLADGYDFVLGDEHDQNATIFHRLAAGAWTRLLGVCEG